MSLYQDVSIINNFKGTNVENWAKQSPPAVLNWMEEGVPLKTDDLVPY